MTEAVEKAKPGPKPKASKLKLAVAVHKINGDIEPGTAVFLNAKDYRELSELEAIREPSEAESALFEKNPKSVVTIGAAGDDDLDAALEG